VILTYILAIASHYLWRKSYIDQESAQVAKLSGQLKNKQLQSEILINSLADGIIVTNPDGKISLINPIAAEMVEWPADEAMGLDVNMIAKLHADNGTDLPLDQNPFSTAFTTKTSAHATLQLVGKKNKETIVSIVASPITVTNSPMPDGVVAVLRDVSAEHKEEKQRADFISTASHEMRTPVAAIEGYLALALNEKVSKIDPKARSYLEKAHESTQHLGKLFQDLLTSARAEDGRLVSHPVPVEMGAYLEQLTDGFNFSAQKKGLLAEFIIGASSTENQDKSKIVRPLYYVHADPDRLREVITNLFDNAVKYTPTGKVSLGLTGNNEIVQLFVRDTGPGIPKDDIPHLFQKFYRVDNSATRTIGGTGLGLFISRKVVELYHGRIWAESELEKGSTFYINLPRLTTQRATELQQLEAQNQGPAPITSLTTPVI
jgi:PAS domain S-box-containing protein